MKRFLLALALILLPSMAMAQCNGIFATGTVCGNNTGVTGLPRPTPISAFPISSIGVGTTAIIGGNSGGPLINNAGIVSNPTPTSWFDSTFCNTVGYIVARTTGGWVCAKGIPANILWFGAIASGVIGDATANATAYASALATGQCVLIPQTTLGFNFGTNTLTTAANGGCITSDNGYALVQYTGNSAFILFRNLDSITVDNTIPGTIRGLRIDMSGAGSASTALRANTSAGIVYRMRIEHIFVNGAYNAYGEETHATNYVVDFLINDLRTIGERGVPFYSKRSRGFFILANSLFDGSTQSTPLSTWPGVEFDDFQGLEIHTTHVAQQAAYCINTGLCTPTYSAAAFGFRFLGTGGTSGYVWINDATCEACNGTGFLATNTKYLNWNQVRTVSSLGNGIQISTNDYGTLNDIQAGGVVGTTLAPYAVGTAAGIVCDTCTHMNLTNLSAVNQITQGLSMVNSTNNNLTNIMNYGNGAYGILESGTSDKNLYSMANLATNTSANSLLTGANSNIFNSILDGVGTFAFDTGGTPTLASCGTSPTINGSSYRGEVTMGTGAPTGCQINFATTLKSTNTKCLVTWKANLALMHYDNSASQIVISQTGTSSNTIDYWCPGAR